jgi:hypothetical protein
MTGLNAARRAKDLCGPENGLPLLDAMGNKGFSGAAMPPGVTQSNASALILMGDWCA